MSRLPVKVDIAFNAGYGTAASSRTWTDVTDYVLTANGINIGHGRQNELSQAGANTCSLTLDNRDGRFSPGLATSPYYPNVKIGRPIRVAVNLCTTGDNGTFEANATSWTGTNATVARLVSTDAHSGSALLSVTAVAAANMATESSAGGTAAFPVAASAVYRASAWVRTVVTGRSCDVRIIWYDSGGALISTSDSANITDSTTWQQLTLTATTPATAAYGRVQVVWVSPTAGEVHYVDDVRLDVDRFTGYIDEWPVEWPATVTTWATSTISASSRSARLGLSDKLGGTLSIDDQPTPWNSWPLMGDLTRTSGSSTGLGTLINNSGFTEQYSYPETPLPDAGQTAVLGGLVPKAGSGPLVAARSWFAEHGAWSPSASGTAVAMAVVLREGASGYLWGTWWNTFLVESHSTHLDVTAAGLVRLSTSDNGTTSDSATGTTNVADGQLHTIVYVKTAAGDDSLYVDGIDQEIGNVSGGAAGSEGQAFAVGNAYLAAGITAGTAAVLQTGIKGWLGRFALLDGAATAAQVAGYDQLVRLDRGYSGETAVARLTRYAGYAGIPAAEYSFDTAATTPMDGISTAGQTPIELMHKVEATDGGVLYDAPDGTLTYQARTVRYNATTALTLAAGGSEVQTGYAPKLDRSSLINKVTAATTDGTYSVTAENTTSSDDYGVHSPGDLELATTDADEAHAAAWWRVNTYSEPAPRAPQLGVALAGLAAARQTAILALKVGQKVAVSNLPSQSDAASKSFFVEGYTEAITDSQHRIDFNVSSATGFDVWEVGHATYGQYDAYPIAY